MFFKEQLRQKAESDMDLAKNVTQLHEEAKEAYEKAREAYVKSEVHLSNVGRQFDLYNKIAEFSKELITYDEMYFDRSSDSQYERQEAIKMDFLHFEELVNTAKKSF